MQFFFGTHYDSKDGLSTLQRFKIPKQVLFGNIIHCNYNHFWGRNPIKEFDEEEVQRKEKVTVNIWSE